MAHKKHQRYSDAAFEKAWKAARKTDKRKRCKRGHSLTKPEAAHRSETIRTGRVRCLKCWRVSAGLGKPKKAAAKSKPYVTPGGDDRHVGTMEFDTHADLHGRGSKPPKETK